MLRNRNNFSSDNLKFILTGATGTLGSAVFYQLLHKIFENNYKGTLVLFIRSKDGKPSSDRLNQLLHPQNLPDYIRKADILRIKQGNLRLIDMDMKNIQDLNSWLNKNDEGYHLIHSAAYINHENSNVVREEIKHSNYLGTINLLQKLLPHLFKVTFISRRFNFAKSSSKSLVPDYYEIFRSQTEEEIIQICEGYGLEWEIKREFCPIPDPVK